MFTHNYNSPRYHFFSLNGRNGFPYRFYPPCWQNDLPPSSPSPEAERDDREVVHLLILYLTNQHVHLWYFTLLECKKIQLNYKTKYQT